MTKFFTTKAEAKSSGDGSLGFTSGRGYYLRPTAGKTPVGVVKKRISQTPQQAAAAAAGKLLAPQYSQAAADAARQNQAIKSFTTALMQQLAGTAPQIQNDYNQQIAGQQAQVDAASNSLRAVNPTGDVAHLLDSIGAPQAQQQQIAGNLNNVFNGGAAVGQYVNGVLPLGALRSQGEAATSLARLQPGFAALTGQQNLLTALGQQKDARMKIAGQMPQLEQDWLSQFHTNQNQKQQLAMEQRASGYFDSTKSAKLGYQVDSTGRPIRDSQGHLQILPGFKQTSSGAIVKTYAPKTSKAGIYSPSASRSLGYRVDGNGNPILVNGKRQILPGFSVNAEGRVIKTPKAAKAGKTSQAAVFPNLTKTQVLTLRARMAKSRNGVPANPKTGDPAYPPISYREAIARSIAQGFSRADATLMANRFYPPGVAGRPSKAVKAQNARSKKGRATMGPPNPNG